LQLTLSLYSHVHFILSTLSFCSHKHASFIGKYGQHWEANKALSMAWIVAQFMLPLAWWWGIATNGNILTIICLTCTGMKLRTNWKMNCYIILHGIHFKAPNINYFPLFQNISDSEFSESEFSFKIQHHELIVFFSVPILRLF